MSEFRSDSFSQEFREKIQFLCALCDSAIIGSIFLQTEHIQGNRYKRSPDPPPAAVGRSP
ncbi:hypothetical protein D3OALGA1CA_3388 [Olavius algarvensis associated proteobacterium Delta 3]|nr:hypothetical protein D3OALGA1CA_3388 [Olavius algarvensis associated proteobacterium Delta 3]